MLITILFVSNNLKNYGRRHFKIFTNCHVSWDTLYVFLYIFGPISWKVERYKETYKDGFLKTNFTKDF